MSLIKTRALLFSIFLLFNIVALAQLKITGVITGINRLPLSGATVAVKGTNFATVTAANGSFSIAAKTGDILEVSFIGYKSAEIKITTSTTLNINLTESIISLDEVVLTGYTSQKIKEITGSVAVVKPKDLAAVPSGQVEQILQGRVAGLNIITSGQPGGSSTIHLHGVGNFGDVTPLYIIDGVQGDINNLNPNDIESLQVLKDAGAYSIYGVRGANGVIVITTKSGKPGKTRISYDFYMGTTRPLKGLDLLNPQEMADLAWIAYKNSGQVGSNGNPNDPLYGNGSKPVLPDFFIAGINQGLFANDPGVDPALYNIDFTNGPIYQIIEANKTGTDWFHEIFKPAFSQNHSLTVSGANEKNKYLFSIGYLDQEGTALNTYLKRYTTRINTEFSVNNNIRMGENLQLAYRDNPKIATQQGPNNNEIANAILTSPLLPVYDIKGGWAHFDYRNFGNNPVAARTNSKGNKANYWEIFGNAFAEADFLKFFTVRTNFGGNLDNYNSYNYGFYTYDALANGIPDNVFIESSGYKRSWTWTNTIQFSNKFGKFHSVKAFAGIEAISNYNREVGGKKIGFFTNDPNYRFLSNGSTIYGQSNYSFAGTSSLYSFISKVDYGYKDKLFLTGTLRRDGASVFGPLNRYGWFPSVSAAWRMTEEKFLQNNDWLTDLKLRASWGKTGYYGNTDPFNQYTLYGGTVGDAYYDIYGNNSPVQGFRTVRLGDPNTGWQEDIVTNIGLESILLQSKLNVTIDWYRKKARGLLFPITLPDILGGATTPNINVGEVENKGVDILLGTKGKWSDALRWDASLTLTTYKNTILKLTDIPYFIPPFYQTGIFVRNQVGHPASSFYGYKVIGIFKDAAEVSKAAVQDAAAPGRFRFLDANNDNIINDEDRVFIGNPNPKFTAGINISITYKNFDFSTFCYGSFGNDVLNVTRIPKGFFQIGNTAKSKALLYESWTPQHTDAKIPIIENDVNFSNIAEVSSYLVEKGTYFRNKSMMLGYILPKKWLQKFRLEKLRVYMQAVNLFTITKYSGLDPELSGNSGGFGLDFGNYPNNQKQYLFGISVNF